MHPELSCAASQTTAPDPAHPRDPRVLQARGATTGVTVGSRLTFSPRNHRDPRRLWGPGRYAHRRIKDWHPWRILVAIAAIESIETAICAAAEPSGVLSTVSCIPISMHERCPTTARPSAALNSPCAQCEQYRYPPVCGSLMALHSPSAIALLSRGGEPYSSGDGPRFRSGMLSPGRRMLRCSRRSCAHRHLLLPALSFHAEHIQPVLVDLSRRHAP